MATFLLLCANFLVLLVMVEVQGIKESLKPQRRNVKLFVFGDSNVDTGNSPKESSRSWRQPYGMTDPGKPFGGFSDGRVLIDYLAESFNTTSPVPYEQRKSMVKLIKRGMNFAYGGKGNLDTIYPLEGSISTQVNHFQQLLKQKVYTKRDLKSSVALISMSREVGDMYGTGDKASEVYFDRIIMEPLQRIHDLGVRKIVFAGMESLGCLPQFTAPLFLNCNTKLDREARIHNFYLVVALSKLKTKNKRSVFGFLDIYSAFKSALNRTGSSLRPCCLGKGEEHLRRRPEPDHPRENEYSCGGVGKNGEKMYTVCKNPNSSFFWDNVHPTQHGWSAVYSALQSSLHQIY